MSASAAATSVHGARGDVEPAPVELGAPGTCPSAGRSASRCRGGPAPACGVKRKRPQPDEHEGLVGGEDERGAGSAAMYTSTNSGKPRNGTRITMLMPRPTMSARQRWPTHRGGPSTAFTTWATTSPGSRKGCDLLEDDRCTSVDRVPARADRSSNGVGAGWPAADGVPCPADGAPDPPRTHHLAHPAPAACAPRPPSTGGRFVFRPRPHQENRQ